MSSEPYEGVITIPVSIPAEIVESKGLPTREVVVLFEDLEDYVLTAAENELHSLLSAFQEAARG